MAAWRQRELLGAWSALAPPRQKHNRPAATAPSLTRPRSRRALPCRNTATFFSNSPKAVWAGTPKLVQQQGGQAVSNPLRRRSCPSPGSNTRRGRSPPATPRLRLKPVQRSHPVPSLPRLITSSRSLRTQTDPAPRFNYQYLASAENPPRRRTRVMTWRGFFCAD